MGNTKIANAGYHHAALRANDFEKSLKFYTEGLGFSIYATWGEGNSRIALMNIGDGTMLELFAGGEDENPEGRFFHFAIKTTDVCGAFEKAVAAGAVIKDEPKTVTVEARPSNITIHLAFVKGPDGEVLEFFHEI